MSVQLIGTDQSKQDIYQIKGSVSVKLTQCITIGDNMRCMPILVIAGASILVPRLVITTLFYHSSLKNSNND